METPFFDIIHLGGGDMKKTISRTFRVGLAANT